MEFIKLLVITLIGITGDFKISSQVGHGRIQGRGCGGCSPLLWPNICREKLENKNYKSGYRKFAVLSGNVLCFTD